MNVIYWDIYLHDNQWLKDVWLGGPCTLFLAGFPDSPCLFTLQVQIWALCDHAVRSYDLIKKCWLTGLENFSILESLQLDDVASAHTVRPTMICNVKNLWLWLLFSLVIILQASWNTPFYESLCQNIVLWRENECVTPHFALILGENVDCPIMARNVKNLRILGHWAKGSRPSLACP